MNEPNVFVARERELAQLGDALADVLEGHGCVRFVVGEAGSGKTALVREFARRAQDQNEEVLVAVGQSDAQTGIGDPFLPFRELLGQLTGDVDAKLAQGGITEENAGRLRRFLAYSGEAIIDFGPDLIGAFIPGVGLATRAASYVARKSGRLDKLAELTSRQESTGQGIDQSNIFEQYTNVIARLAEQQPLILILDDLQWADTASAGLLFRLGRSVADSRVLLVGTYRPAEVAIGRAGGRHPLDKVVAEFKRYFGDISIDLGDVAPLEAQWLIHGVIDAEPNSLTDGFRQALFDHTAGHPLFTIELLRAMQERGDLVRDDQGRWAEGPLLDWNTMPARVEGVIEERIGRLEEDLLDILTVASVEGEDFTAEVVARVQDIEARRLVRQMGRELERQHRLIRSRGVRQLEADGRRLSLYAFHHNLFQRYLYLSLDEADRAYLHEDVGNALEELCADCPDEFVVQLARHFVEAGITDKAARYLHRAGALSVARYANDEAVDYFTRALALTPEADALGRWEILQARERVYGLQGEREAQFGDLDAMRHLADELDDNGKRAEVELRSANQANATGHYSEAVAAAEQAIRFAAGSRDVAKEARGHREWGGSLIELGRHDEARSHLEQALALAESAALHSIQSQALKSLARIHSERGEFEDAAAGFREALRICQRLNDSLGEPQIINNLGVVYALQGDYKTAGEYFEQALERSHRMGDRRDEGARLLNLGELATERHQLLAAKGWFERALEIGLRSDDQSVEAETLAGLGGVDIKLGLHGSAQEYLRRALDVSNRIGQQHSIGVAMAWFAMLSLSREDYQEACRCGGQALEIARMISEPRLVGRSLDFLGQSYEGMEKWREAAAAYEESLAIRTDFEPPNVATEPTAGLARVALALGDADTARSLVDDILGHLTDPSLDGTQQPLVVYLTCDRILRESGGAGATQALSRAHDILMGQLADIDDQEVRRAFCENVPANRELLELVAGVRV